MTVTVNGKQRDLPRETPLLEYLAALDINMKLVAIAHNGAVLRRDELPTVTVRDGDSLEIVHAVGGG